MSSGQYSEDQIRQAVREALLEALPAPKQKQKERNTAGNCALMRQILESIGNNCKTAVAVDVDNVQKLNGFIRDLVRCLADQDVEAMILSGRMKFEFEKPKSGKTPAAKPHHQRNAVNHSTHSKEPNGADGCVETGVLTEAKILALAKHNKRVVLGSKVVLTPLARDRARAVGLEIVRQQS